MKELVAALLPGVLTIPFGILFIKIYNESKVKKAQKERLFFCQNRLHQVALLFRNECMAETKKVIARYTAAINWKSYRHDWSFDFVRDYRKAIDSLKKDYLGNYAMTYSGGDARLSMEAEDLPAYVLDEYEAEVSEIANTFYDLGCCMIEQIEELKQKANEKS